MIGCQTGFSVSSDPLRMDEIQHHVMVWILHRGPFPAEVLGVSAGQTVNNLRDYIRYDSLEAARKARQLL